MTGTGVVPPPGDTAHPWPGAWFRAHLFAADPRFPGEARAWVASGGPTDRLPVWVWWAEVPGEVGGFALVYHQLTGEIGFWLACSLRGRGLGAEGLRQALSQMGRDKNRLLMATVPRDNPAALRTCAAAGLRPIAEQHNRVVFGLYR